LNGDSALASRVYAIITPNSTKLATVINERNFIVPNAQRLCVILLQKGLRMYEMMIKSQSNLEKLELNLLN